MKDGSIHNESWPEAARSNEPTHSEVISTPVQIDGKVRASIFLTPEATEEDIKKLILANPSISHWLGERQIKRIIYKRGKIVSIVA